MSSSHTAPDWSWMGKATTVFPFQDMAELVRRLNPIFGYDDRGNVFFHTSFEHGIASWGPDTAGTGADVRYSAEQARARGYSCELVAGSDGQRYALIRRYFHYPVEGKIGWQFSFTLDPDTDQVRSWLLYYDGENVNDFRVLYDHTNGTLKCGGSDGGHTTLDASLSLFVRDSVFHTIKVVVDLENIAFVRVIADGKEYNASAADVQTSADTSAKRLEVDIEHKGDAGANANIWVDDFILTQNEP